MENLRERKRSIYGNEKGAAMIVVVCVLMVVMLLCLTMIVGAYQTLSSVSDGGRDISNEQQAMSFSEVLRKNLSGEGKDVPSAEPNDLIGELIFFAADDNYFIDGGVKKATEEFEASAAAADGPYGNIRLSVKKRSTSDDSCRMFITVTVENSGQGVSTVTSGYDVKINDLPGSTDKKADITFYAYYD